MNHDEFVKSLHAAHRRVAAWMHNNPDGGDCGDERIIFYFEVLHRFDLLKPGTRLLDLGGGLSWFAPMAHEMGLECTLVDDFGGGGGVDTRQPNATETVLDRVKKRGIRVIELDFLANPLPLGDASIEIVTCFHSLEHWHHSPKALFAELRRVLVPGGWIFIATPNAVNLRKRAFVLLGKSNLPMLHEWYDEPVFRGHVREPVVADLRCLLEWNGFAVRGTYGRNFIGRDSEALAFLPRGPRHLLGKATQVALQCFPSLCSDIHVIGQRL
jgi:SAM-dependent methyltransferase